MSGPARVAIGGQALIEGVMMRGPGCWAVAVRKPDGQIVSETHDLPWSVQGHPWVAWPFLRGLAVLAESLAIGMRALRISAGYSLETIPGASPDPARPGGGPPGVSDRQLGASMAVATLMFAAVFIAGPALAAKLGSGLVGVTSSVGQNLVEGGIRLTIFLGYISLISLIPDIRRVYQYHGAEHKTIAAYEHGDPFVPRDVDRYSTLHVRCGTNFLFIVLFLTVIVGLGLDFVLPHSLPLLIGARVLMIPVLAAGGYEVIRAAGREGHSRLLHAVSLPGLALQKITTRAPSLDQIQVAIAAIEAVIAREDLPAPQAGTPEPA